MHLPPPKLRSAIAAIDKKVVKRGDLLLAAATAERAIPHLGVGISLATAITATAIPHLIDALLKPTNN